MLAAAHSSRITTNRERRSAHLKRISHGVIEQFQYVRSSVDEGNSINLDIPLLSGDNDCIDSEPEIIMMDVGYANLRGTDERRLGACNPVSKFLLAWRDTIDNNFEFNDDDRMPEASFVTISFSLRSSE